jgi:hypothetical protein
VRKVSFAESKSYFDEPIPNTKGTKSSSGCKSEGFTVDGEGGI